MTAAPAKTFDFQAETKELLDLVVHSLYTEKEIFVRELISNASDALEKLRQIQLTEHDGLKGETPLEIHVTTDESANTVTIRDTGVGMTCDELIANLGTIARSGSKAFLDSAANAENARRNLIGQFGVGFYSAFMVANTVTVYAHSWRQDEPGHVWTSDGTGTYDIAPANDVSRGTTVVVELKEEYREFANEWKLRETMERYSAFVSFPITLNGTRINTVEALWLRNKNEATDREYAEFYKFQAHAFDEPRLRLHFSADAPLSAHVLLFVPNEKPEKFGVGRDEPSVALYSRRVLIDARPKDLLPNWLRFLRGVVDSEDVPLNISREMLRERSLFGKLRSLVTVRFLRFLDEEAAQRPDSYRAFYEEFGHYIKEGAALDFSQRDALAKLLRFESSVTADGTMTSFAGYVSRMKPDQTEIYYLIGPRRTAIENGPYVEGLRALGYEVLYCFEPVDEYVMNNIHTFCGKTIVAADHAHVKLPPSESAGEIALSDAETSALIVWLRQTLDQRVADIQASNRLVDSPVLAVTTDRIVSSHMRRMMKAMNRVGADAPVRVTMEINLRHPVIKRLSATHTMAPDTASLVAQQLLDNALLAAGLLEDPTMMVARLNQLLLRV
jgi:TNF receptor-associated protein 1